MKIPATFDPARVADISFSETEAVKAELEKLKNEVGAIREESYALGAIRLIEHDLSHKRLFKYAVLYKIKQSKEYKKGGMTWEEFCESVGENKKTVGRILSDIESLYVDSWDKMSLFLGMPFNKTRYLGKSIRDKMSKIEDGTLIIDDIKIPLIPENKDEIEAAIDTLKDSHRREREELQGKVKKLKKRVEKVETEETKGLKVERDALIKENLRLKVFDPEDKEPDTWCLEQMEEVEKTANAFMWACQKFIADERIKENIPLQGQVEGKMREVYKNWQDLNVRWNEAFPLFD
jgi:hypothetical protein